MNSEDKKVILIIAFTSFLSLSLCVVFFVNGSYIIIQNLIYVPILIACMYFRKQGFMISVIIALIYLLILSFFSKDHEIILQGVVRFVVFVGIGLIVTYISIKQNNTENSLEEKETLLREVHHRIKNNMANVEGLLLMQADSIGNPEAKAALQESLTRVKSIRVLYDKLLLGKEYHDISIKSYVEGLLETISSVYFTGNEITIKKQITDFTIDSKKAVSLGIIINELLTNVFKYAVEGCEDCNVSISIKSIENSVTLIIKDNGIGIDEKINLNKSPGLGYTLVKMLVEQLGGTYSIVNENGTKSTVQFEI